jgi:hypothetical protein
MRRLSMILLAALGGVTVAGAQPAFDRLGPDALAVQPPASRVQGAPGRMRIVQGSCDASSSPSSLRRRIVDIAIQEWAFFGFGVVDQMNLVDNEPWNPSRRRRTPWLNPAESARVAASIAGYWSVTADGAWILERQNAEWAGEEGVAARWRDPWSAAFISWVMCEAGLNRDGQFRRAIAHHAYIDQAIAAREDASSQAAYAAFDVGERPVEPGDLLCSARRPAYRSIAERRSEIGSGIRSHCDVVVRVDPARAQIMVIGGNVRGAVSLKLLPAEFGVPGSAEPRAIGRGRRAVFAHLKLSAASIEADALTSSPTLEALRREPEALDWLQRRLAGEPAEPEPAYSTFLDSSAADTLAQHDSVATL